MGGAGLALIDDPGALTLNPARLAAINSRRLLLELGARMLDDDTTSTGLVKPDPSINPYAGTRIANTVSADEPVEPALLAYAHPLPLRRPLVIGFAREQVADLSLSGSVRASTTPLSAPVTPNGGDEILMTSRGDLDIDMKRYHLGAGWRITPHFSVGGAVVVGTLDLSSRSTGRLADPLQFTAPGMFDPRFSSTAPSPLVVVSVDGSDSSVAWVFGAWWRVVPGLSLATTWRQGSKFSVPGVSRDRLTGQRRSFDDVVNQPDRAALGVAWNPFIGHASARLQSVTIALDLERVQYEDQLAGFVPRQSILTRGDFVRNVAYEADDAVEARLGAEYEERFVTWTLAVRGGLYTAHDGGVYLSDASGDVGALQGLSGALERSDAFAKDDMTVHATVGAGARFYGFALDGAIDLSGDGTRVSISTTVHLGRGR